MSFWDSTQGSSDGSSRSSWWDSPLDHAGPKADLYGELRVGLALLLAAGVVGLLGWLLW